MEERIQDVYLFFDESASEANSLKPTNLAANDKSKKIHRTIMNMI